MLLAASHANRLNADWNTAKEREVPQILTLPAGLETASETHYAAISNSSIGSHGIEAQAAQHTIALRSSEKMTANANRKKDRRPYHDATCPRERHSTRNRHGKTPHQNVLPANPAK
jgi:hypothetical protein